MKGSSGHVLYVGKAKSLRQRLKQYFLTGGDGRAMIPSLVSKIDSIDLIIVSSEKEALLLESNLIKQYKPHYNALFKDDKSYIAITLTHRHSWPMLQLARNRGKPESDSLTFGPYTSAAAARTTFDLLNRLFPLRQCSDQEFLRRTRPCILYDMKRCCAPCVGKVSKEEYEGYVQRTIKFLRGQNRAVLNELYIEMQKASEALEFEKAASILTNIRQIEKTLEGQYVDRLSGTDTDALSVFRQADEVILCQLIFRQGKLTASKNYSFSHSAQDEIELLESFIVQHYESQQLIPEEIILPIVLSNADVIAEILTEIKQSKVLLTTPQRGNKKTLLEMAYTNAQEAFRREKDLNALRERTLMEMQEKFHLANYPYRIECFDNSNLAGTEPVSSLIAFSGGQKDSARYRIFKIKSNTGSDDYAAMREVLERRCKRGKEENNLPDLIIVDGGKGHLNLAIALLAELNIVTVDVISIAKEESRHDKGSTQEQIFLPNVKDPLLLKSSSPILFLLQQIRDEAHRVAITFQRKRRSKKIIKSVLDDLKGIGPVKKKLLLNYFGSLKKLKEASKEDLEALKGLSKANIEVILAYLHP